MSDMKTKKILFVLLSIFMLPLLNQCQDLEQDDSLNLDKLALRGSALNTGDNSSLGYCGDPVTLKLLAGKSIDIGRVIIGNDAENLYVSFQTSGKWVISLSHLFAGPKGSIPVTKSGNPIPGSFPFMVIHEPNVTSYKYSVNLSDLPECFVIALQVDAVEKDIDNVIRNATAWAFGDNVFQGKSWGWFQNYCVQTCNNIEVILNTHQNLDNKLNELIQSTDISSTLELARTWLLSLPYIQSVSQINFPDDWNFEINYTSGLTSGIIISKVHPDGTMTQGGHELTATTIVNSPDKMPYNPVESGKSENSFMLKSSAAGQDNIITDMDVIIYEPFENQFDPFDKGDDVFAEFYNSNLDFDGNVVILKNQECTIAAMNNLTDYGFVYIDTHGSQGKWMLTGQIVNPETDDYNLQISEGKIRIQHNIEYNDDDGGTFQPIGNFYGVSDVFITSLNGSFPNSIIFNSSCQSTLTEFLSDAFIGKGAKTYLGVDDIALASFLKTISIEFVHNMVIDKNNTGQAFANLSIKQDVEPYLANIEIVGDNNMYYSDGTPLYSGSVIENATPSILELDYDLTLADIEPSNLAFNVQVNAGTRDVVTVAVSGTTVMLTLQSPVRYGDVVTVSYTKPENDPLQTASGVQAASITAQAVKNNVASINPVYVSSVIVNSSPYVVEMTYDRILANIIPPTSAFRVMVNSSTRSVNSVSISGPNVMLTLASPVVYGDVITVSYTKPAANPLQTLSGGYAATMSSQTVINNCTP
jgi:uncharacterized repeat protein (TIGR02059 family)